MNAPDDPTLDERLARLAPSASPDPDRLAAARAALDAATAPPTDDAGGGHHDRRSSIEGGAHVLDLGPHDAHVEVVTPLDAARRARDRRRRRVTLAAASVGVLGVVGTALVLSPVGPDLIPASPERSCAALVEAGMPGGPADDLTWRTLAHESWSEPPAELTLLVDGSDSIAAFCADTAVTTWPGPSSALSGATPEDGEVVPLGVVDESWYVVWGVAGPGVDAVDVQVEGTDEGDPGSHSGESGTLVEARVSDGYWSAVLGEADVAEDALTTLRWRLTDGSEKTMELGDPWAVDGSSGGDVSPAVAQRRDACAQGWDDGTSRPVIEERRDDHGVALFELVRSGEVVLCVQEASPPYRPVLRTNGVPSSPTPAADEAAADSGSGAGGWAVLEGRAGDDVARVEIRTAGGTAFDAALADGHWLVWGDFARGAHGEEAPWLDATITWYLHDGSKGGSKRVFE